MVNSIKLVVGDWSGDGHGQTDDYVIESNLNRSEIDTAYKKGSKILGFDFCKEVAAEYDDCRLLPDQGEALIKHLPSIIPQGIKDGFDDEDEFEDYLSCDDYLNIYLNIVKLGNPEFKFDIISEKIPTINIGGYGLYS